MNSRLYVYHKNKNKKLTLFEGMHDIFFYSDYIQQRQEPAV